MYVWIGGSDDTIPSGNETARVRGQTGPGRIRGLITRHKDIRRWNRGQRPRRRVHWQEDSCTQREPDGAKTVGERERERVKQGWRNEEKNYNNDRSIKGMIENKTRLKHIPWAIKMRLNGGRRELTDSRKRPFAVTRGENWGSPTDKTRQDKTIRTSREDGKLKGSKLVADPQARIVIQI